MKGLRALLLAAGLAGIVGCTTLDTRIHEEPARVEMEEKQPGSIDEVVQPKTVLPEPIENPVEKYALVIGSHCEPHNFYYGIWEALNFFKNNGFEKDNIIMHISTNPDNYSSSRCERDIQGLGTLVYYDTPDKNPLDVLNGSFDRLKSEIDENDFLFVYITGHGEVIDDQSAIYLSKEGQLFYDSDMEELMSSISNKKGVILTDVCFGEGFIYANPDFIGISASGKYQPSNWVQLEDNMYYYGTIFFNSLNMEGIRDYFVDKNKDGNISLEEIFLYTNDQMDFFNGTADVSQNPQIYNKELADDLYLVENGTKEEK